MPESRSRKKAKYTPPPSKSEKNLVDNPRWLVPAMVACFLIGLTWIVLYYTIGNFLPGFLDWVGALGNVLIGFIFILAGFILAMRWR